MKSGFQISALITGLLILMFSTGIALAEYPDKPVTLVAPYGPGGAADLSARIVAGIIPKYIDGNIIVVNKTGAAGVTGSTYVAKAKPNGYTMLLARIGCQTAVPAMNKKIPYKWDDFTIISLLEKNPFAFTINANSPYKTIEDIIKAINEGKRFTYASTGIGSLQHLSVVILMTELGLDPKKVQHIPFKGGGKAGAAVIGGHVDIFFQNLSGVISHIQGGKLKCLGLTNADRLDSFPDVPTFTEMGYPNMEKVVGWSGIWGPGNLPKEVVDKWVTALEKLKQNKDWNQKNIELGSIPNILGQKKTFDFVKTQYDLFERVTSNLGLTIE